MIQKYIVEHRDLFVPIPKGRKRREVTHPKQVQTQWGQSQGASRLRDDLSDLMLCPPGALGPKAPGCSPALPAQIWLALPAAALQDWGPRTTKASSFEL